MCPTERVGAYGPTRAILRPAIGAAATTVVRGVPSGAVLPLQAILVSSLQGGPGRRIDHRGIDGPTTTALSGEPDRVCWCRAPVVVPALAARASPMYSRGQDAPFGPSTASSAATSINGQRAVGQEGGGAAPSARKAARALAPTGAPRGAAKRVAFTTHPATASNSSGAAGRAGEALVRTHTQKADGPAEAPVTLDLDRTTRSTLEEAVKITA